MKSSERDHTNYTHNIIQLLQKYFPEAGSHDNVTKPLHTKNSRLMQTSFSTSHAFQTISNDFLCCIEDCQTDIIKEYLISPSSSELVNLVNLLPDLSALQACKHDYLELIYIVRGESDYTIAGKRKRYYSGECCLINQNVLHKIESTRPSCITIHLSIQISFLNQLNEEGTPARHSSLLQFLFQNMIHNTNINYLDFYPVIHADDQNNKMRLSYLFYSLIKEMLEQHAGYQDILRGYLKRLFYILQQPAQYTCQNICYHQTKGSDLFEQMLAYIQSHRYKVSRSKLADELHYNGNYLSDIFQKNTGITLSAYIRDICLQEAASLLLNTDLTIAEIVHLIHYENRTVFYKHFRNKYGVTPKEYRTLK